MRSWMKLTYLHVALLSCCLSCTGSEQKNADLSQRTIQVVTTTGMIADAVTNVGGDRVQVKSLMGPGVDPHLYKASEGDVNRMMNADILFYNGLHLEGKMAEIFEKMETRVKTAAVTHGLHNYLLLEPSTFKGNYDPHVWFDVTLWMQIVEYIRDSLIALDPSNMPVYWFNAQDYLLKLSELQKHVISQSQKVPLQKRILITAHDAFNYFGRAYDFEVRGLQGISTSAEAGTGDVQSLAQYIVGNQIPAIFVETSVPPRYIDALQAAVKSQGFDVKIGGSLYSDAMGDPKTEDGTYIGMVRHNIDTVVNSLLEIKHE